MNMNIWVVGTTNRQKTFKIFKKTKVVTGKTSLFVIGPFCTTRSICLNIGF